MADLPEPTTGTMAVMARPSAGRPTREQAQQRQQELLDCALNTFLECGFAATTMENIATRIGMSKRTIYAYYADKEALFRAAVAQAIERYRVPLEALEALVVDDFEETLLSVGRLRIRNVAHPISIKLQRILAAETHRFPDLFHAAFARGAGPTIAFLSALFTRGQEEGKLRAADPERAATAFLSVVVGGAARIIVSGTTLPDEELEARIHFGVELFLQGMCARK